MPIRKDIKKVLLIGSGPIVIGQAAEFDYAGTQACRALKEDGLEVVLVNSNPATIMTDNAMADRIYIEPLTIDVLKRIIIKEKPDSILSTLGGQTGLTLSMQLAKDGFLEKHGVKLLGADPETIDKAEDRQIFKDTMESIGQPCIPSKVVTDIDDAKAFAHEIGYPVIIRPAFTLGGTGGGICKSDSDMDDIAVNGLRLSPIHQILVEKCISGWKEIEFEVIRDSAGNAITVCSMENFDPVGIHTGDSIVVAPAVTLSDAEYQMLRTAALDIVSALEVEGGCNCQFALRPDSFEYAVIEVNPRVSRSSALASKATGYPIAKVATKIAVGYLLPEIRNAVTGTTYACFEPSVDYIVVKFPKWPFDKFVYAKRDLGTQMKATGEVMSIGPTFEHALMKAIRGAEISHDTLNDKRMPQLNSEALLHELETATDERIFLLYAAIKKGVPLEKLNEITKIDLWFLSKLQNLAEMDDRLHKETLTDELYLEAKKMGFKDSTIEAFSHQKISRHRYSVYKTVDTCAAEFKAQTPYFYATYDDENEALEHMEDTGKKKVVVLGSGPIRIGQGIEFDYASVHCVWSLKEAGYEVIIINNNPETVSTDFDTADRLYFEPLTDEDVMDVLETEKPDGVVVAFGGGTAIKLTNYLNDHGVKIIGTCADSIDMAEDRKRFDALLERLEILRPKGYTVLHTTDAIVAAEKLGYPVLMRPSYVLGGQNMIIAFNEADIREYMAIILSQNIQNPVLIDKYLMGIELEVDAICDGKDILIPGIMEHIERAGIHSGDSIAVYPAWNLDDKMTDRIIDCTKKLAVEMNTVGLVNIQYLIYKGELYVIEVNPRSSRTVPYISKVTGVPMVDMATRAMLGEKIPDMGYGTGLYRNSPYIAVKVPVFSFSKLSNVDNALGPEMKSTGEVLGIAPSLQEALFKGLLAAGYKLFSKNHSGVLITVKDPDKIEAVDVAKKFSDLGYKVYATQGTYDVLTRAGISCVSVKKLHEDDNNNTVTLMESGKINFVLSTSAKGRIPTRDSVKIRRKAVERGIPCLTSIDTANAVADSIRSGYSEKTIELIDINNMRKSKMSYSFCKMYGCGNDYIYFDCFSDIDGKGGVSRIDNPQGLSVALADRHMGIGGDGVVLICRSDVADAKMKTYNKDGSEGEMGGNSIRCVAKFLYDKGFVRKDTMTIETLSGIKTLNVSTRDGKVVAAGVDMGKAILSPEKIPVLLDGERAVGREAEIGGKKYKITAVSMGNPHCVVFTEGLDGLDLEKIGPEFENSPLFPERTNTEFVTVLDDHTLKMRVWERGNGETRACGTGACAAAVAAVENGYCKKGEEITVKLRGGDLVITYTDDNVYLYGDAIKAFEGTIEL